MTAEKGTVIMDVSRMVRHIIGYAVGFTLFIVIIPFGLISFSNWSRSLFPWRIFETDALRLAFGLILIVIGLVFAFWSNAALLFIGKGGPADGFNVAISPRTQKLVVSGPYRYTRNPMVFGAYMIYFSIALFTNSLACLGLLIIFFCLTIFYLKATEEKRLYRDFGQDFLDYKKSVSMIIPLPK